MRDLYGYYKGLGFRFYLENPGTGLRAPSRDLYSYYRGLWFGVYLEDHGT